MGERNVENVRAMGRRESARIYAIMTLVITNFRKKLTRCEIHGLSRRVFLSFVRRRRGTRIQAMNVFVILDCEEIVSAYEIATLIHFLTFLTDSPAKAVGELHYYLQ